MMGWIEEHPYMTAGLAIGGVVLLYLLFSGGSSGSAPAADSGLTAYYAAEAASTQAGDAVTIAQSNNAAQTAQVKLVTDAQVAQTAYATDLGKFVNASNVQNTEILANADNVNNFEKTYQTSILADAAKFADASQVQETEINANAMNVAQTIAAQTGTVPSLNMSGRPTYTV